MTRLKSRYLVERINQVGNVFADTLKLFGGKERIDKVTEWESDDGSLQPQSAVEIVRSPRVAQCLVLIVHAEKVVTSLRSAPEPQVCLSKYRKKVGSLLSLSKCEDTVCCSGNIFCTLTKK